MAVHVNRREVGRVFLAATGALLLAVLIAVSAMSQERRPGDRLPNADPLPSWNEGPVKQSIIDFVNRVTKDGSKDFVPVNERIATFDNDGTLWVEQPFYTQLAFIVDRIKKLAPAHPEWKQKEPFRSALAGDLNAAMASRQRGLDQMLAATTFGMTTQQFDKHTTDWIATAKHPRFHRRYTDRVYQPMLELLAYLRANDFKTFIVSGGGVEFMRPWTDRVYGVPPDQVVGSTGKPKFEIRNVDRWLVAMLHVDF